MNKISGLKRDDGSVCADSEEEKIEIQYFYQSLYTSQGGHDMSELLNHVPVKVTPEMNTFLNKPFEPQEIHDALFQMSPSKDEVTAVVLGFLNGGVLPLGLNDTTITLIPKVHHPQMISQFCPIVVCPVLYKLAAKAITN